MENVKQTAADRVRIRLLSTAGVHTPGLVRWCLYGWRTERKQRRKQPFLDIMRGYGLPADIARQLLDGTIPYAVEGESLVFELSPVDADRVTWAMKAQRDLEERKQRFRAAQERVKRTIEALRRSGDAPRRIHLLKGEPKC